VGAVSEASSAASEGWVLHDANSRADEVAGVIAFLASEAAVFVNGVILSVDGGLHKPRHNFVAHV
jgi:NAD(P)-dependent dehydrogenase (short-subunit alcohol dehydrogenase family)